MASHRLFGFRGYLWFQLVGILLCAVTRWSSAVWSLSWYLYVLNEFIISFYDRVLLSFLFVNGRERAVVAMFIAVCGAAPIFSQLLVLGSLDPSLAPMYEFRRC